MVDMSTDQTSDDQLVAAVCALALMGIAGAMVPLRAHVTPTTIAFVLVTLVVLIATIAGQLAGVFAAVVATLSFDFLFTKPYLSLKIASADDAEITALLLACGLMVGTLSARASRTRSEITEAKLRLRQLHRLAEMVVAGTDPREVATLAERDLAELFDLQSCRFELAPAKGDMPVLHRSGALDGPNLYVSTKVGFELPRRGVALPVLSHGREVGRFVMMPTEGVGTSMDQRIIAVALADQVGAAIGMAGASGAAFGDGLHRG
jgi:Domain of unknown function (DUF4118)